MGVPLEPGTSEQLRGVSQQRRAEEVRLRSTLLQLDEQLSRLVTDNLRLLEQERHEESLIEKYEKIIQQKSDEVMTLEEKKAWLERDDMSDIYEEDSVTLAREERPAPTKPRLISQESGWEFIQAPIVQTNSGGDPFLETTDVSDAKPVAQALYSQPGGAPDAQEALDASGSPSPSGPSTAAVSPSRSVIGCDARRGSRRHKV